MADDAESPYKLRDTNREDGNKFSYYLAGVTLGILAFSLQAYKKPPVAPIAFLYIGSWALLLVSFLASVQKLKLMIAMPGMEAMRAWNAQRRRTPENNEDIRKCEELAEKELQSMSKSAGFYFRAALWTFFLGLVLQASSKTWEILLDVGVLKLAGMS